MEKNKYKTLIVDVFFFGIGTIGSKLIMFLLLPIYTNALSTEEYGVADLVFSCSEILRPFISLAIYNALQRYGLSKECDKDEVFKCASLIFIAGSIFSIIITPLFGVYGVVNDWKWYLTAYAIAVFAQKNIFVYTKISDNNKLYALMSILQAVVLAISNILLLIIWNHGIEGYLLSNIIAPVIVIAWGFFASGAYNGLKGSRLNFSLMRDMIRYSLPFIINDISWWLIHSSDKYMIERMMDKNSLGLYAAATKIPLLVSVIASIFSQAWDISVVREYERDNDKEYYERIFRFFIILVSGICLMIICIIKPFMGIYVGEKFVDSWRYVPLLISAEVFYTLDIFSISFFAAMKKSQTIMWPTIIGSLINVILNYILISRIGIWGAIVGTWIAYLFMMLVHYYILKKMSDLKVDFFLLITNCTLILVESLLIGRNFHIFLASVCGTVMYLIVNRKHIISLWHEGLAFLRIVLKRKKSFDENN